MELPPLPEHVLEAFSSIMQYLDKLDSVQHLNFLAQLADFAQLLQEPLRRRTELPTGRVSVRGLTPVLENLVDARILLYDGLSIVSPEEVIPFYEAALKYLADHPEIQRLFSALKRFQNLYAIYRLWVPGLMTSRELADFVGMEPNDASNTIKSLRDTFGIIEQKTRGIYARGENGRMAMNLFAVLVALWRKADDVYTDLAVEQVARLVRYGIDSDRPFSVLDRLEKRVVPIGNVPSCEPIVVSEAVHEVQYSTSPLLYHAFLTAMNSFLDNDQPMPMKTHDSLPLRTGKVIRGVMRVSEAFRRTVSDDSMLFVRFGEELRFLPLSCSQMIFQY